MKDKKRLVIKIGGKEIKFGYFDRGEVSGRIIATSMKLPSGRMLIYNKPGMEHYGFNYPNGKRTVKADNITPAKIRKGGKSLIIKYFPFIPKDAIILMEFQGDYKVLSALKQWYHGNTDGSVKKHFQKYGSIYITDDRDFANNYGDVYKLILKSKFKILSLDKQSNIEKIAKKLKEDSNNYKLSIELDWIEDLDIKKLTKELIVNDFKKESNYDSSPLLEWIYNNFSYDMILAKNKDSGIILNYDIILKEEKDKNVISKLKLINRFDLAEKVLSTFIPDPNTYRFFDQWWDLPINPNRFGVYAFEPKSPQRAELQVSMPYDWDKKLRKALDSNLNDNGIAYEKGNKVTYWCSTSHVNKDKVKLAARIIRAWLAAKKYPDNRDLKEWWWRFK